MSELLDPMHRWHIKALGIITPGTRTLEVGCGDGSVFAWLAEQIGPGGKAVAIDLDLSLIEVRSTVVDTFEQTRTREPGGCDFASIE
jgi:ubiquinone/menaquinone biosynthesis C-methylase UbiE